MVPLCRRCHTIYHDWGIGSFSPDTTDKAQEVENKRRGILRSLPVGHLSYRNLPLLKLEDVKRSRYWYKKHGIAPPMSKKPAVQNGGGKPLEEPKLTKGEPLCGWRWYEEHRTKTLPLQGIEIYHNGECIASFDTSSYKPGQVRKVVVAANKGER